jgi:hypothetical protein
MTLTPTTLLFFDASCLFAASASSQGGSAYLLSVCARGYLQVAVSLDVLMETERNILEKLSTEAFSRYEGLQRVSRALILQSGSSHASHQIDEPGSRVLQRAVVPF